MNRIFKCKTRGTKVYQCHKYKLRQCFELDTILEQKSWVLRIYKVGPAYLKEGNRPNYQVKRKAVFLQKQDFFFPESPNVNQNISWKQLLILLSGYIRYQVPKRTREGHPPPTFPLILLLGCFPNNTVKYWQTSNTDKPVIHHSLKEGVGEKEILKKISTNK